MICENMRNGVASLCYSSDTGTNLPSSKAASRAGMRHPVKWNSRARVDPPQRRND